MRTFIPGEVCVRGSEYEDAQTTSWAPALPLTFLVSLHPPPSAASSLCLDVYLSIWLLALRSCQWTAVSANDCHVTPHQALSIRALMSPAAETTASYTAWEDGVTMGGGDKSVMLVGNTQRRRECMGEQAIIPTLVLYLAIKPSSRRVTNELYPPLLWK